MSQIIGKVGMTPRGMYDRTRAYERLDVVTYQGSSWVAIVDVPAQISPAMGSDYWQLQARMGETGPQGPVGPQGNSAFDGTGVELVNNLTQGGQTAALSAEQGKILKQELTELESEVRKNSFGIAFQNVKSNGTSPALSVVETKGLLQKGNLLKFALVSNSYSTHSVSVYLIRVDGSYVSAGRLDKLEVESEYLITEDFDYVRFYNNSGSGEFEVRIAVLVKNNLLDIMADKTTARSRATCLVDVNIEETYQSGKVSLKIHDLTSATSQGNRGYLYHEKGFATLVKEEQKDFSYINGYNALYYDVESGEFCITHDYFTIPTSGILLELFYAYNNFISAFLWTSPFIKKIGLNGVNTNSSCFLSEKVVDDKLSSVIEPISADVADTKEKVSAMELQSENGKVYASTGSSVLNIFETIGLLKSDKTIRFSMVSDAYENHSISVYLMRANGSYVSLGTITEIGAEKTYRITEDFEYIRFYNNKGSESFSVKLSIVRLVADSISVMSAKIFRRVGCIGDSYTSGHIHLQGANAVVTNYDYAWPHYMSGLTNNKWTNFGQSGSTAKQWVVGASRLGEVKESGNKCQAYIIGLMINDQGSWSSYATPVGNKSDIGTDADTYYAWYYKLVQEVISVNASAKIFCNTCPNYANDFAYNVAVRDIVAHCKSNGQNVYLCDLASDKYNNETYYKNPVFLSDAVNGHFTAIGYEFMAECYIRVLSDVINSNVAEFQNVFQIPCDL